MPANGDSFALNVELFNQLTAARGWQTDLECAAGIGVSLWTVWRARKGEKVSAAFMAKTCSTLNVSVDRLFRVTQDTAGVR